MRRFSASFFALRTPGDFASLGSGLERRYAVLSRLLSGKDITFLRTLPGYKPAIERKLRRDRRRIFRLYLKEMVGDYRQILRLARVRPLRDLGRVSDDATKRIMAQALRFRWQLLVVATEFILHGLHLDVVNPSKLVRSLIAMHKALAVFHATQALDKNFRKQFDAAAARPANKAILEDTAFLKELFPQ
jgi:hypothetical protein